MCLCIELAGFTLLFLATSAHAGDEIADLRNAGQQFIELLRRNARTETLLLSFGPEAFDNPLARRIVDFTGGSSSDSPAKIRSYVAKALKEISKAATVKGAHCPDRQLGRQFLAEKVQLDNNPDADGFALLVMNEQRLRVLGAEADPDESTLPWLKARIAAGHHLALMGVACNHVPIILLWEKQRSGKWLIIGFAIAGA